MNRRDLFRVSALSALGGSFPLSLARSADQPLGADEMIHKYLVAETKRISAKFMDGAKSKAEWEKIRPRLKREFLDMLGLDPLPEKTPLKATVTGSLERGEVVIEKLHYQSKPGLYVTANLYRPKSVNPDRKDGGGTKLPAVLYVCGHSGRGRDGNKTAFQDHGMWFASNGYVCLIVDTLQLGEIAGKHHGTYNLNRFWWHSRGYTPAGVECWNGIRGIDYLCSLPYVDAEKIGVTGISGGGATTNWVAAADDRVKVAVPVSGVSDLECYVTDQVINGHCDCMFFHNIYQWEWTTALALFAPKPLLFANSDDDKIFPMTGNKRIIERLRTCYAMFGAKENVDEHVSKGGHDYRPDLRIAIFAFFHKHLKGDKAPIKDADFPKIEGKELRAFADDKDIPKDAINATADETFVPVAKVALPTEKNFGTWKTDLVKQLKAKVFQALPEKIPAAKLVRPMLLLSRLAAETGVEFETDGTQIEQGGFPPAPGPLPVIAVLNAGDTEGEMKKWVERLGKNVLALLPRGVGATAWSTKNPPNTVERSFALLGQTADSGRVRDVAAFLAMWQRAKKKAEERVRVVGRGQAGILAVYAILLTPGLVDEITIADLPVSHRDGPHFLNVMRVLDIPEALGLLAPQVKLTLIGKNAKDKAFDRTAAIFAAAGAKDKFKQE
ncbi:acetyl xylan esterase : Acetyl xylan esterase OS=Isosphaera pallida (strain ATCC 43644 / DSM 9630 / IS1B) GN=Isop_1803 PE=4 SV=1: Peptidase_S9 [Gemmata massiliana]|uniref:Peptidase S9 prolyl oligopeptidase catalytic domain-containing protein n=1 Tax=Gemmata massiliana TaxID=1210884 RepID=A0A6P2CS30_9BACT|nr:prolyl oligopeptidase family serine peptidase [Gemmata massiliana]VTR90905.1 acetyl xylan esterase : Acetyl xylan esterase OS=Isosphaera pallida (strain ATCC 43644 / DSM 9630 / IS1B) GN=Isop_1803 PE=4 SV=1: Peptidase_S9 [Gemmata massiliana]